MADESLADKVLRSIFFRKATQKAGRYASNTKSLLELIQQAISKSNNVADKDNKGIFDVLRERIMVLGRMIKAYASGEYRVLPLKSLIKIIAAIIYFVSPVDFIPDFLPVIGLTDDVALIIWLFRSLRDDINDFLSWEQQTVSVDKEALSRS